MVAVTMLGMRAILAVAGKPSGGCANGRMLAPVPERRSKMAIARVVTFEGVPAERIEKLREDTANGEQPEGLNATEMLVLHDADTAKSIAIVFFDSEEDYKSGDAVLNAMDTSDTPGTRTSVSKYDVAIRMTQ